MAFDNIQPLHDIRTLLVESTFTYVCPTQLSKDDDPPLVTEMQEFLNICEECRNRNIPILETLHIIRNELRKWNDLLKTNIYKDDEEEEAADRLLKGIELMTVPSLENFKDTLESTIVDLIKYQKYTDDILKFEKKTQESLRSFKSVMQLDLDTLTEAQNVGNSDSKSEVKSRKRKSPSEDGHHDDDNGDEDHGDEKKKGKSRPCELPRHVTGVQYLPVVTSLRKQGYGDFYAVSLSMKSDRGKYDAKKNPRKTKYLDKSFSDSYSLGRNIKSVEWMVDPELLKFPEERRALIEYFLVCVKARKYHGTSQLYNSEFSGVYFYSPSKAYIESNSRSYILNDGFIKTKKKGKEKKIARCYLRQFLFAPPAQFKFILVQPGVPMSIAGTESNHDDPICRTFSIEEIHDLIEKFKLDDVFQMTKKDVYSVINPRRGDWVIQKNAKQETFSCIVTDYYDKAKYAEPINNSMIAYMDKWNVKIDKILICERGSNQKEEGKLKLHHVNPTRNFRSLTDYDSLSKSVATQKVKKLKQR